ncbi:cupin domain-containing protein [Dyadobacter sp. CY345]|uniref:cupin domain-containing protein n=1 Tax=Dyadobacter sp. CY345 TaxID=2909335 RepID=UPI001F3F85F8|nr:cupin domain-containing protein [Dyadobacter sp. CY345]MCF2444518.1 cupin domain-containing protein [Dyadobacter sp. CY345]
MNFNKIKPVFCIVLLFAATPLFAQNQQAKAANGKQFIVDSEIPWQDLGGGLKRKIMSYDPTMMMVKIDFQKGGIGAPHKHVHTQMSYVESGVFELTIGDKKQTLKKGDGYYIPSNIMHGAVCLEAGVLIDMFTPMREDFVK